jgi:hypothetical protein
MKLFVSESRELCQWSDCYNLAKSDWLWLIDLIGGFGGQPLTAGEKRGQSTNPACARVESYGQHEEIAQYKANL